MTEALHILSEPYRTALDEAVAFIHERYQPVGIVASGSIVRGTPGLTSDLDLVVVHEPAWRQRTQRFFNGVPAEVFVNPAFQIRRQMASDAAAGRPVMAHMLATGLIVEDTDGILAALQREAHANLAAGPRVTEESLLTRQYHLATGFEDAHDIREVDPDRAHAIVTAALTEAVNVHFLRQGRWLPHFKTMLSELDDLDPQLGGHVRSALRCPDLDERLNLATPLIERFVGAASFFEWQSEPQDLSQ